MIRVILPLTVLYYKKRATPIIYGHIILVVCTSGDALLIKSLNLLDPTAIMVQSPSVFLFLSTTHNSIAVFRSNDVKKLQRDASE